MFRTGDEGAHFFIVLLGKKVYCLHDAPRFIEDILICFLSKKITERHNKTTGSVAVYIEKAPNALDATAIWGPKRSAKRTVVSLGDHGGVPVRCGQANIFLS